MPDRIQIPRPEPRTRDPQAWLGEALQAVVLIALILGVGFFARVLARVRGKLELDGDRAWLLVIGFLLIELYLAIRVVRQVRRARAAFRSARPSAARPS